MTSRRKPWALLAGITAATVIVWLFLPRDPFMMAPERSMTLAMRPAVPGHRTSWIKVGLSGPRGAVHHQTIRDRGAPSLTTRQLSVPEFEELWARILESAPPEDVRIADFPDPTGPGEEACGEIRLRAGDLERVYQFRSSLPGRLRPLFDAGQARLEPPSGAGP